MRFLVPVDGSTDCQAATHVAYQLAAAIPDCELVGINVVNVRQASGNLLNDASGYVGFEPAIVGADVLQAHEKAGQALVDSFVMQAHARGLTASGNLVSGAVTEQIVSASNTVDLVIMGLRGESNDRFPGQGGAQTANAIPQFSVPALLVPREITRIRAISVGYDGSPAAQRALRSVRALAKPLEATVHLIHVGGEANVAEERFVEAEASLDGVTTVRHHVHSEGGVHETLVNTTREAHADLLVLGFKGKSTLKDVVFGSAREHLINQDLKIALLVAH